MVDEKQSDSKPESAEERLVKWLWFSIAVAQNAPEISTLWDNAANGSALEEIEPENFPAFLRVTLGDDLVLGKTSGDALAECLRFFGKMRAALTDPNETPWDVYQRLNADCGRRLNAADQARVEIDTRGWRARRNRAKQLAAAFDEIVCALDPAAFAGDPLLKEQIENYQAMVNGGSSNKKTVHRGVGNLTIAPATAQGRAVSASEAEITRRMLELEKEALIDRKARERMASPGREKTSAASAANGRKKSNRLTHLKPSARDYLDKNGGSQTEAVYNAWIASIRPKNGDFIEGTHYPTFAAWRNWVTHK